MTPPVRAVSPPDAVAVLKRFVILKNLFAKAFATPPLNELRRSMRNWRAEEREDFINETRRRNSQQVRRLWQLGLWDVMEKPERDFMQAGLTDISAQSHIEASWLSESAVCLLWALGYVSNLPPYDRQCDIQLTDQLPKGSLSSLIESVVLRPASAIGRQRDIAELWHWRSRTRQLQDSGEMPSDLGDGINIEEVLRVCSRKATEDGFFPSPIDDDFPAFGKPYREITTEEYSLATSIATERHRALNWLCGYAPGNRWTETPTDT